MKILFLSNLYPPNAIGGYERLCFDVASAFVARGHEVLVLTSNCGDRKADYPGQRVFRDLELLASRENIYAPARLTPQERAGIEAHNAAMLRCVCVEHRPDVVFVWNLYFLSGSFLQELWNTRIPCAYFLTDNWLAAFLRPAFVADYFGSRVFGRQSLLRRWRVRLGELRWARSIANVDGLAIFSSAFMAGFYREAGLRFDNSTVVHNGVRFSDQVCVRPDRGSLVNPGRMELLFAGRVVEIKGVLTAIRALPEIVRRCSGLDVRLTILGDQRDQPFVAKARALSEQLGVADRIEFHTSVDETRLPALFGQHDIYLFPSLYEPFSLTLLHAMHAGIPIVASRAGGNPEAIAHRSTGLLHYVDDYRGLADAVLQLVEDAQLRVQVSTNAVRESLRFTFDTMVDRLIGQLEGAR